jgi:uncharacterized repeat protein (TIGR01451 family)
VFQSLVSPIDDDQFPSNNSSRLTSIVVGSYDPNDKQVEPELLTPQQLAQNDNTLVYTIRFQNTGNYYAENVRIVDTLSENLNIASMKVLASSHLPMDWFLRDGRVLEFNFKDIFLPDSTTSEPLSHGFVKFSIETNPGLSLGDQVNNTAAIYFDFNAPIYTNEARMVVDNANLVLDRALSPSFAVLPNPNNGNFTLELPNEYSGTGILTVFNDQGQALFVQDVSFATGKANIAAPYLLVGKYIGQLTCMGRQFVGKILVSK